MAKRIQAADPFGSTVGPSTGLAVAGEAICLEALIPSAADLGKKLDLLVASFECTRHSIARGGSQLSERIYFHRHKIRNRQTDRQLRIATNGYESLPALAGGVRGHMLRIICRCGHEDKQDVFEPYTDAPFYWCPKCRREFLFTGDEIKGGIRLLTHDSFRHAKRSENI